MYKVLLTCEHATNHIPKKYLFLFSKNKTVLNTHKGIDFGALDLAQKIKQSLKAPLIHGKVSRLIVDLNRSLHHKNLFSLFSHSLLQKERNKIVTFFYTPYREKANKQIKHWLKQNKKVLHLSVHSFTPVFNKKKRPMDIGLLYDPKKAGEKGFCSAWKKNLFHQMPDLKIQMNAPYRGTSDALTTSLRKKFKHQIYLGIELEVNQGFFFKKPAVWKELQQALIKSLKITLLKR